MTLEDIRRTYEHLDRLCGVDTSSIKLVSSTRMKTRLGYCQYREQKPVKIVIASFLFDMSEEKLLDTALHEYAHALVKLRRPKENHGHDAVWKAAAAEVGCTPSRTCQDEDINQYCRTQRRRLPVKYNVLCKGCGRKWEYRQKGRVVASLMSHPRSNRFVCPFCKSRRFSLECLPPNE